jgi:hypothetical protein
LPAAASVEKCAFGSDVAGPAQEIAHQFEVFSVQQKPDRPKSHRKRMQRAEIN